MATKAGKLVSDIASILPSASSVMSLMPTLLMETFKVGTQMYQVRKQEKKSQTDILRSSTENALEAISGLEDVQQSLVANLAASGFTPTEDKQIQKNINEQQLKINQNIWQEWYNTLTPPSLEGRTAEELKYIQSTIAPKVREEYMRKGTTLSPNRFKWWGEALENKIAQIG